MNLGDLDGADRITPQPPLKQKHLPIKIFFCYEQSFRHVFGLYKLKVYRQVPILRQQTLTVTSCNSYYSLLAIKPIGLRVQSGELVSSAVRLTQLRADTDASVS